MNPVYLTGSSLGFDVLFVDGHTEKQMIPVINYKGQKIVFAADLIPTHGHIPCLIFLVMILGRSFH